jgi:hypothetical protein
MQEVFAELTSVVEPLFPAASSRAYCGECQGKISGVSSAKAGLWLPIKRIRVRRDSGFTGPKVFTLNSRYQLQNKTSGYCSRKCYNIAKKRLPHCLHCRECITVAHLERGVFRSIVAETYCSETRAVIETTYADFCSNACRSEFRRVTNGVVVKMEVDRSGCQSPSSPSIEGNRYVLSEEDGLRTYDFDEGWD